LTAGFAGSANRLYFTVMNFPKLCLPAALCAALLFTTALNAQLTPYEKSGALQTATYAECIQYYQQLDKQSPKVMMKTMGLTDAGLPLHLLLVSADGKFDPAQWHKQGKTVIMVNNGIHPGEPDGIDASMMLVRNLAASKTTLPANVCLAVIPVYNIGGCLNRSPFYRVDQNGPAEFGFRGNSQNLDLNRDFIKCDSRESRSFAEIFQWLDPDVFLDNHVSNGADYQHVMTLISTQHNKLGGVMGEFMHRDFTPAMFSMMHDKGYDMVPYVNHFGETPDKGWTEFFDGPRYSTGYAALFGTFGFVAETHMLKPYQKRVDATYKLMQCLIEYAQLNGGEIKDLRRQTKAAMAQQREFVLDWSNDKTQFSEILYKGYEAGRKPSAISGQPRLYYDRNKPFEKKVPFYNYYKTGTTVRRPAAYIIPQGWWKVIELLQINRVNMRRLTADTALQVEMYRIADYKSGARPYEGHHGNNSVKVEKIIQLQTFRKGDYLIPMNQAANRFIVEVLEPQAPDSYFAWNYFDAILGQKEGYSDYVFEDTAEELLKTEPGLRQKLETRRAADSAFAKNGPAQLDFIYRNSKYFEPDYMRYPVCRVMQ
jgi:Zinc carboxypeptidase